MTTDVDALIAHTLGESSRHALRDALAEQEPSLNVTHAATPEETRKGLEEAAILLTFGIHEEWYDRLGGVEWIQVLSSGVNHIELDRLAEQGIIVTNAAGVHAQPIAEQVLGYMLMFERNLLTAVHQQERGVWERFRGGELGDGTVGIVGLGAIGSRVAQFCSALGMTVIGTKRETSEPPESVDEVFPPEDLREVLSRADYLVLSCPLTDETRGLIDRTAFETMSSDAVILNIARGEVIVEEDLIEALQQGRIAGAGLDVFAEEPLPTESTLWDLSNVVLTPHMAGSTPHYWARCARIVAANLEAFESGSPDAMPTRVA